MNASDQEGHPERPEGDELSSTPLLYPDDHPGWDRLIDDVLRSVLD